MSDIELSKRETEVLLGAAWGMTKQEIADELGIKVTTVRTHMMRILSKLEARNTAHAVFLYRENLTLKKE